MARSWKDSPPENWLYPWLNLSPIANAKKCLQEGEENFEADRFYKALWCYEHWLLSDREEGKSECEYVFYRMAACCHKLGQEDYPCTKRETSCELSWYRFAIEYANKALHHLQDDAKIKYKAFMKRAKCMKKILDASRIKDPQTVGNIVEDYLNGYRLSSKIKPLAAAMSIASRFELLDMIHHECSTLSDKTRVDLFKFLENDKKFVKLLFTKPWDSPTFKGSDCGITLRQVLPDDFNKADEVYMDQLLTLFNPTTTEDVMFIIKNYPVDAFSYYQDVFKHSKELDFQLLCNEACKAKKYEFSMHIIEQQDILPSDCHNILQWLADSKDCERIKDIVNKHFKKHHFESVNFAMLQILEDVLNSDMMFKLKEEGMNIEKTMKAVIKANDWKSKFNVKVFCLLVDVGADCTLLAKCSPLSSNGATVLHVATQISLSTGDTEILENLITFCEPTKLYNSSSSHRYRDTPLHMAAKYSQDKEVSHRVLSWLLDSGLVDQFAKDRHKKKACQYIVQSGDKRATLFDVVQKSKKKDRKKSRKKKSSISENNCEIVQETVVQESDIDYEHTAVELIDSPVVSVGGCNGGEKETDVTSAGDITFTADESESPAQRFVSSECNEEGYTTDEEEEEEGIDEARDHIGTEYSDIKSIDDLDETASMSPEELQKQIRDYVKKLLETTNVRREGQVIHVTTSGKRSTNVAPSELPKVPTRNSVRLSHEIKFDHLPWEVEITKQVLKYFKSTKRVSDCEAVAQVIYEIAEGKRSSNLYEIAKRKDHCCLYKAVVPSIGHILWEQPIAYSLRASHTHGCEAYSQIIRVWEICSDSNGDQLFTKAKTCAERIENAYKVGKKSPECLSLRERKKAGESRISGANITLPITYQADHYADKTFQFIPLVTTNKMEYEVNTFYSFDTMAARSIIAGTNMNRDYPFKEWHAENEIIQLQSDEAILLLGRSGTGKTTCCLYRMWNEFKDYWIQEENRVKITRKCFIDGVQLKNLEESGEMEAKNELQTEDLPDAASNHHLIEEDLHQIFVTKNRLLCGRMKKSFYKMAAAYDFLDEHLQYEFITLPSSFGEFKDQNFPAFLSARQFYLMLDKSLEDGQSFFDKLPREQVKIKIISHDYDDGDDDLNIFDDAVDFDNENGRDSLNLANQCDDQSCSGDAEIWTEVTSFYFKENIWPKLMHKCKHNLDPMLVWLEIQSFIKGSSAAISKGSPLDLEEYKNVGNKMAPTFSQERELIYKFYDLYEKFMQDHRHDRLFDEGDLIMNLHQRRKAIKDVSWSIHSVYIDEVQDFTQAELEIFTQFCRNPNSMFYTGDTAQSIMRGIAFRFEDLRSIYHGLNKRFPEIKVPSAPKRLILNYRSHSSVLKLAGTIIDLIEEFFQNSIDHLPKDKGLLRGPKPVFLQCEPDEISQVLNPNSMSTSLPFGAYQAIIVQSKEAKERLPTSLKRSIKLTVLEAKGLEFNDVLLYNFFSDSIVDEKTWRVVASYLRNHEHLIVNRDPLPGEAIRDLAFDERHHKSLNSELKFLYTAITRAKCNLWIFESSGSKKAEPILEYWHKRNAMKRATVGTVKQNLLSPSTSSDSDWREQGDVLRRRHIWSEACFCYARAGLEDRVRETQYEAITTSIKIGKEISSPHLRASLLLLQINENVTKIKYVLQAAKLLTESHTPMYEEAARMFELQGRWNKAVECYKSAGSFENFARLHESKGNYDAVIEALLEKPFQNHLKALQTFLDYSMRKITVKSEFGKLVKRCADHYSTNKNTNALLEVLKHAKYSDKIKYLKRAEMYDEVIKNYMSTESYSDIVNLAVAQGMVDKSFTSDVERAPNYYQFVFMKAKHFLINGVHLPSDDSLVSELKQYSQNSEDEIQALALLLIGMITSNGISIEKAHNFEHNQNKAFQLEAFNQVTLLKQDIDMKTIQRYCRKSECLIKSLRLDQSKFHQRALDETLWVYAIQKRDDHCVISKHGQLLIHFDDKNKKYDLDGMMCLSYQNLIDQLCDHFYACCQSWYDRCNKNTILLKEYEEYTKMFEQMTPAGSKSCGIDTFIQICLYMKEKEDEKESWLKIPSLFTFEVSNTLNVDSLITIMENYLLSSQVRKRITTTVKKMVSENEANIDKWFHIWKLNCIFSTKTIKDQKEGKIFYAFQHWIQLCKEENVLLATRRVIKEFLDNIIFRQLIFSVQNIVDILTFHCMSLFDIVSQCQYLVEKRTAPFYFPSSYTFIKKLFDHFKRHNRHHFDNKSNHNVKKAIDLLEEALKLLINCPNSPLKVALNPSDSTLSSSEPSHSTQSSSEPSDLTLSSKQCLILALILLANLKVHRVEVADYRSQILLILQQSLYRTQHDCQKVITVLKDSSSKISEIFKLVVYLQAAAFGDKTYLKMRYYSGSQFHENLSENLEDIVILSGTLPSKITSPGIACELANQSSVESTSGASSAAAYSHVLSTGTTNGEPFSLPTEEFPPLSMTAAANK